jgi:hypothetical protein
MPTAPNCHTVCASSGVRPRAPVETWIERCTRPSRTSSSTCCGTWISKPICPGARGPLGPASQGAASARPSAQLMRGTAVVGERSPEHSAGSEARKSTHPLPADPSRGAELHRRLWRCGTSRLDVRTSVPARHRDSSRSALLATTDVPSQPSFRGCGKRGEALRCLCRTYVGSRQQRIESLRRQGLSVCPAGSWDLDDVDGGQLP